LQDKIRRSQEFEAPVAKVAVAADDDDDDRVPF
jgi:hypothetical protein